MERRGCSLWCIHNACLASSMKMSACLLHPFCIPCILDNFIVCSLHPICILCISVCKIAFFLHPFSIHCIHSVEITCITYLWLHPHFIHNASHESHASPLHLQYILNTSNLGMQFVRTGSVVQLIKWPIYLHIYSSTLARAYCPYSKFYFAAYCREQETNGYLKKRHVIALSNCSLL